MEEVKEITSSNDKSNNHINKDAVRKGKGITGTGTFDIKPHLSGRLTMGMLKKMEEARKDEMFVVEVDNEFDRVKELLENRA